MRLQIKIKYIVNICSAIPILIFMWILFGFNMDNADWANYERRFTFGTTEFAESGFNVIINICKYFGISNYQGFLEFISLILLIILFICTVKYSDKAVSALVLFFFYPFILFCIEVRFSIAFCIVLNAILVLLNNYKYSIPIFIGLIILATMFHSTSLLYLILIFHKIKITHRKKLYIMIWIAVVASILTYTPIALYLASWISGGSAKITLWFTNHGRFGMTIPIMEQVVSYAIFIYAYKIGKKRKIKTLLSADILYDINILMFFLIPCYFVNTTFFRLFRVILFVNTLFFSEIIYHKSNTNLWKITKLGMLNTIQIIYLSFFEIFSRPTVWRPIFEENIFIVKISGLFNLF